MRGESDRYPEVHMPYIVKWETAYLAAWGNSEERTYLRDQAKIFKTKAAAKRRIERIRKFRTMHNLEIEEVS